MPYGGLVNKVRDYGLGELCIRFPEAIQNVYIHTLLTL
jgi:hypothetical protein